MSIPLKYSSITANHIIECDISKEILFNIYIKTQVDDEDYVEEKDDHFEDFYECENELNDEDDFYLYEEKKFEDDDDLFFKY